jgi:hypothetical protein
VIDACIENYYQLPYIMRHEGLPDTFSTPFTVKHLSAMPNDDAVA